LLRRLAGLGFERVGGDFLHFPPVLTRRKHSAESEAFHGKLGDTRVHIRLRKGAAIELRVSFTPRVSSRRASKFLSKLGIRALEGTWT
jgi:hypothetical protein